MYSHWSHSNGFTPEWFRLWTIKVYDLEHLYSHWSHSYGVSFVWIRFWTFKVPGIIYFFSHRSTDFLFVRVCDCRLFNVFDFWFVLVLCFLTWTYNSVKLLNFLKHFLQLIICCVFNLLSFVFKSFIVFSITLLIFSFVTVTFGEKSLAKKF